MVGRRRVWECESWALVEPGGTQSEQEAGTATPAVGVASSWTWVGQEANRFPLARMAVDRWPWVRLVVAAVVVAGLLESWEAST